MRRISGAILAASFLLLSGLAKVEAREFGLGVIFGEPQTGLSLKLRPERVLALDAALAWSGKDGESAFRFHGDALFHSHPRVGPGAGGLTFYYGLGGRYVQRDKGLGLRLPLGLSHLFRRVPLEVFIELVPTLDLTPNTEFQVFLAGGLRIYPF